MAFFEKRLMGVLDKNYEIKCLEVSFIVAEGNKDHLLLKKTLSEHNLRGKTGGHPLTKDNI